LFRKAEVAWHKIHDHDSRDRVKGPREFKGVYALKRETYEETMQKPEPNASQVIHHVCFGFDSGIRIPSVLPSDTPRSSPILQLQLPPSLSSLRPARKKDQRGSTNLSGKKRGSRTRTRELWPRRHRSVLAVL
jgi:hypothetical protein